MQTAFITASGKMAINTSAISGSSVTNQQVPMVIELLSAQPDLSQILSPARPPGQVVGYYNGAFDGVELYVVSNSGLRFLRVV